MEILINKILKISEEQQKSQLRYFTRCAVEIKLQIIRNKTPRFHKLRQEYSDIDKSILEYCAMVIAIQDQQNQEKMLSNKSFGDMTLEEIEKFSDLQASKFKSKQKKRGSKGDFLLAHWAEVRRLRLVKNFSFRDIADYFNQKYRDFEVSKSKVQSMWTELENTPTKESQNG
ncbi:hypothetical protein [Sulfuricurvum sp.]|uniref:hypothetical protein n=1 Tax=Sulfuricurvum sp. TaxID=2025608 RepID=UPI002617EF8D|nr:hypothetical protein [Sulfuricurvum sp.]MDD3594868.1 hypothetical protein [Sulfuricurvum sp.]